MEEFLSLAAILLCLLCAGAAAARLKQEWSLYASGREEYKDIQKAARRLPDALGMDDSPVKRPYDVFHTVLTGINEDYRAWIRVEGTEIDYPVVAGEDNDYYINHTFTGKENPCGAIFIDANCTVLQSDNTIIYGHNRKDRSMFGTLKNVKSPGFLEKHDTINLFADGTNYTYRIFAVILAVDGESDGYTYSFSSSEERVRIINRLKAESIVWTDYVPLESQRILTLSTCIGSGGNHRLLVLAAG